MTREIRTAGQVEARAAAEGAARGLVGYAAVFDSPTEIAGYFVEKIAPGAFSKAIGRDDVRCLFNHSDNLVLGRTASGTLRLSEDAKGLRYECDPPNTAWANDLMELIGRGDVSQSSFAFRATREEWDETGDLPVRTVLECELFDVSPVTYPAYEDSEVGLRKVGEKILAEARSAGLVRPSAIAGLDPLKLRMRAGLDLRLRNRSRL
jgi:HK97 family phage prohead protease